MGFFNKDETFIIAELSGNHLQNLNKAKELIKSAYESGTNAIKIQTYTPNTISMDLRGVKKEIKEKYHKVKIDHPDWKGMSYNKLYEKAYTPWNWHSELNKVAKNYGLILFSSPFDFTAVDFLEEQNVPIYKIASYDVINLPLIRKIAQTKKPVIMSVGMASEEEIKEAIETLKENGCPEFAILHCVSSYPTATKDLNLSKIKDLGKKYNCVVGFSDHSLDINSPAMAVLCGAKIIERHLILNRKEGGPDASFSSEPMEFKKFVNKVRNVENKKLNQKEIEKMFPEFKLAYGNVIYGPINNFEKKGIEIRPSIWTNKEIKKNEIIKMDSLKIVRPGNGLKPKYYDEILGKKAKQDIDKGIPLSWDLIEG